MLPAGDESSFLFGGCVDRRKQSSDTIYLLLAYRIECLKNFFILRGNHEYISINRIYEFYDERKWMINSLKVLILTFFTLSQATSDITSRYDNIHGLF